MDVRAEKEKLRQWAKGIRHSLDLEKVSKEVENKILSLDTYKTSRNVMSYIAKDIEVSLDGLFQDKTKNWFLPSVETLPALGEARSQSERHATSLYVVPYTPGKTKLIKNQFEVYEPEVVNGIFYDQLTKKVNLDLIFVPGLCFDKNGYRLGFGKGFYDSFLKLNTDSFRIGVCPEECFINNLPVDKWDIKVDMVIQG